MFISDWTGVRTAVTSERERERERGKQKIGGKPKRKNGPVEDTTTASNPPTVYICSKPANSL